MRILAVLILAQALWNGGGASSGGYGLFYSNGNEGVDYYSVRPKILLKSDVKVDVSTYETGKDANGVWQIK